MLKILRLIISIAITTAALFAQVVVPDFAVNDPAQNTLGVGRTAITAAADGKFAVAWQDYNEYGMPIPAMPRVGVRMFTANAVPIGPLNLFNGETRPLAIYDNDYLTGDIDLSFLPGGSLLVMVQHEGQLSIGTTWVFSIEAGIGAVSSAGQIIDLTSGTGVIYWLIPLALIDWGNPRIAVAPAGNFFVILSGPSHDTGYSAVMIQAFDTNGDPVGDFFSPHPNDPGPNFDHRYPDIATDGSIHLVVWQDSRQDANYDITAQFYNNVAPIGGNLTVNAGDPGGTYNLVPSVAMNASGNSVAVWADTRISIGGDIYGQRFNAAGQAVGGNFRISTGSGKIYDRPEVAMRNDGSFMVVWTDSLTGYTGIAALRARARQYDANGNPATAPFLLAGQDIPSGLTNIASNGLAYYCAWLDVREDNVTPNVYARVMGDVSSALEPPDRNGLPVTARLEQNYPNPFNPGTEISYQLSVVSKIRLEVFDLLGRPVRLLAAGQQHAGSHTISWDGRDERGVAMPSGIYTYRLTVDGRMLATRKMVLLR